MDSRWCHTGSRGKQTEFPEPIFFSDSNVQLSVLNFNCLTTFISTKCRLCIFLLLHSSHSVTSATYMGGWVDGSPMDRGLAARSCSPARRLSCHARACVSPKPGGSFPLAVWWANPWGSSVPDPELIFSWSWSLLFPHRICIRQWVSATRQPEQRGKSISCTASPQRQPGTASQGEDSPDNSSCACNKPQHTLGWEEVWAIKESGDNNR